MLIWGIDLTLARAWPRDVRTTDDSLKANDGKTPSTTRLIAVTEHTRPLDDTSRTHEL